VSASSFAGKRIADFSGNLADFVTNGSARGYAVRFSIQLTDIGAGRIGFGIGNNGALAIDQKVNSAIETQGIAVGVEGTTDGTALRVYTSTGGVGTITTVATLSPTATTYDFIIVRSKAPDEVRYYLDGVLVATHTTTPPGAAVLVDGEAFNAVGGWLSAPIYNAEL
jgi:hypothetical protein